jgi:hypothetical protein
MGPLQNQYEAADRSHVVRAEEIFGAYDDCHTFETQALKCKL